MREELPGFSLTSYILSLTSYILSLSLSSPAAEAHSEWYRGKACGCWLQADWIEFQAEMHWL